MSNHAAALTVLRDELDSLESQAKFLSGGLQKMLSRSFLADPHSHLHDFAVNRWRMKLDDVSVRIYSIQLSIKVLEEN